MTSSWGEKGASSSRAKRTRARLSIKIASLFYLFPPSPSLSLSRKVRSRSLIFRARENFHLQVYMASHRLRCTPKIAKDIASGGPINNGIDSVIHDDVVFPNHVSLPGM